MSLGLGGREKSEAKKIHGPTSAAHVWPAHTQSRQGGKTKSEAKRATDHTFNTDVTCEHSIMTHRVTENMFARRVRFPVSYRQTHTAHSTTTIQHKASNKTRYQSKVNESKTQAQERNQDDGRRPSVPLGRDQIEIRSLTDSWIADLPIKNLIHELLPDGFRSFLHPKC